MQNFDIKITHSPHSFWRGDVVRIPKYLKAVTTDNGSEFAAHLDITAGLHVKGLDDVTVYFTDSYCSRQKDAVENVNKLIRQYIPKKSNFKHRHQEHG